MDVEFLRPKEQALDIRIPSDVQYIEGIVQQVVRRCEVHEFPRRHLALNVPVALTEALSNAILRGNLDNVERSVHIRADVDSSRLVLEVRDEGEGFDLDACTSDPTLPDHMLREDGRGLFLMRRLMTKVERYTDGGNVVRLILLRGVA